MMIINNSSRPHWNSLYILLKTLPVWVLSFSLPCSQPYLWTLPPDAWLWTLVKSSARVCFIFLTMHVLCVFNRLFVFWVFLVLWTPTSTRWTSGWSTSHEMPLLSLSPSPSPVRTQVGLWSLVLKSTYRDCGCAWLPRVKLWISLTFLFALLSFSLNSPK